MELNDVSDSYKLIDSAPGLLEDIKQQKYVQRLVPFGCVALLTPHVHSFFNSVVFSASALLAGNVVIHKPSRYTPAIGRNDHEIWDRCNLKERVQHGTRTRNTSLNILSRARICMLWFVQEISNGSLPKTNFPLFTSSFFLEVEKTPAIVLESADLVYTADALFKEPFELEDNLHAGFSRVFVENNIEKLMEELRLSLSLSRHHTTGKNPPSMMGPLISEHAVQQYQQQKEFILVLWSCNMGLRCRHF